MALTINDSTALRIRSTASGNYLDNSGNRHMYLRVGSGGTAARAAVHGTNGSFMVGTSLPSSPHIELKVDGTANFVGDDVRIESPAQVVTNEQHLT